MVDTVSVGKLTPAEKAKKIEMHRKFHAKLLDQFSIPEKDFNVKSVFSNGNTKVVGLFPNEFTKEKGFYFELIDSNLDPIDPKRRVYRMLPRDNFADIYNLTKIGTYSVPLDELELVPTIAVEKIKENYAFEVERSREDDDESVDRLTIRDLAAILWQKEVSGKSWLNSLISKINKEE